jgi:hypothetical protein
MKRKSWRDWLHELTRALARGTPAFGGDRPAQRPTNKGASQRLPPRQQ